jgi:hypothetical protein
MEEEEEATMVEEEDATMEDDTAIVEDEPEPAEEDAEEEPERAVEADPTCASFDMANTIAEFELAQAEEAAEEHAILESFQLGAEDGGQPPLPPPANYGC